MINYLLNDLMWFLKGFLFFGEQKVSIPSVVLQSHLSESSVWIVHILQFIIFAFYSTYYVSDNLWTKTVIISDNKLIFQP